MRYEIVVTDGAYEDLKRHRAYERVAILDLVEKHLRHEPTRASKSRIKVLHGLLSPQYRLRIGEIRVLYDVCESAVYVIAVVNKAEAAAWLAREGIRMESEREHEDRGTP